MLEMKSKPQLITRDYWIGRWRDDPNDAEWDRAPRRPAEVRPGRRDRLGDQLHRSLRVETDVRGASSTIRGAGIGLRLVIPCWRVSRRPPRSDGCRARRCDRALGVSWSSYSQATPSPSRSM